MKVFENRKIRGAISIFLVMITIPTLLLSAVLIDGSRMASAKAIAQEAGDLAAVSALTDYNVDLKDSFGLLAMKDSGEAEKLYKDSLQSTLLASGLSGSSEYSEQLWEILKNAVGVSSPYADKKFLNLYDFQIESCSVTPKYSLGEWQVLENQMVEYAKFRGIYVMTDRLGVISELSAAKAESEKNKQTAQVMNDKIKIDEKNADADKALTKLREKIRKLNTAVSEAEQKEDMYFECLRAKMEEIQIANTDSDSELSDEDEKRADKYSSSRSDLKRTLSELHKQASDVRKQAEKSRKEVDNAIKNLESFQSENQSKSTDNDDIRGLIEDAQNNISTYKSFYIPKIESILNDSILSQLASDDSLSKRVERILDEIDDAIYRYENEPDPEEENEEESEEEEEEDPVYYFYYLRGNDRTEEIHLVLNGSSSSKCYRAAAEKETKYFQVKRWEEINPTVDSAQGKTTDAITEDFAQSQSEKQEEFGQEGSQASRGEVASGVYAARPSKTFASREQENSRNPFFNKNNDLSGVTNIMDKGTGDNMILQAAEAARDDVLCLSYMFGTFKTRLTGVEKFSRDKMPQREKDNFYMPKWRYAHDGGEIDMRFTPKKDRDTVLRGEIEYLICGNRTDALNENCVYSMIYAERLVNNEIALYRHKSVNGACHLAAAAASTATGGTVPEPVFFWIFLTAWAIAETQMDMHFLIDCGYKIPVLKSSKNVLLTEIPTGDDGLVTNYGKKGLFVSYEDYLLIMLLMQGEKTRLMRSADLIEFNMKKQDSGFTMAEAYTYLQGTSQISTRYLFGNVMPFQTEYEKGGVSGRMKFSSEIYLGY